MRHYQDRDVEDEYTYARPTYSAWIAAVAVAFAFFVLGGFIKTYRQLETLKEESRREIRELRTQMEALRADSAAAVGTARQVQRGAAPLPPAARTGQGKEAVSAFSKPGSALPLSDSEEKKPQITYTFGRSSKREGGGYGELKDQTGERGPLQVVAVALNREQKRLMVEGGKDVGLDRGSRLEVSRQGKWIGDLRVVDVYDNMSACELLHATLPPEPGDMVRMP